MKRKGSTFDTLIIAIVIFTIPVIVMMEDTVLTTITNEANRAPNMTITTLDGVSTQVQIINTTHLRAGQQAILTYDQLMPFIFIGLICIAAVLAFMTPSHPILFVPSLFTLVLIVIVAAQLTNAYGIIANTPELQASANKLTISANMINNLPLLVTIAGAIIMIAMAVTYRRGQEIAG